MAKSLKTDFSNKFSIALLASKIRGTVLPCRIKQKRVLSPFMLFESYLRCCALTIIKILEVSSLNVILDQKLNYICNCALRNVL